MKYENEINEMLRNAIHEDWMSDDEYDSIVEETLSHMGITKEEMSEQIEAGIENGFPVDVQLKLLKNTQGWGIK